MTSRARIVALLGALLAAALMTLGTVPAEAAPYSGAASVTVSQSSPCHGATITIGGTGYVPGSTVVLTIGGVVVGRAKADRDGDFSVRITLPDSLHGTKTVLATGSSGGKVSTTRLTIRECGGGSTAPGGAGTGGTGAGTGGSPSTTGAAVLGLLVVAVGLLAGGAVLMVGGRRRRAAPGAA